MDKKDAGFDFDRYRKLLAEADDDAKRLALIDLLIDERARDKLAAERSNALIRRVVAPRGGEDDGRK